MTIRTGRRKGIVRSSSRAATHYGVTRNSQWGGDSGLGAEPQPSEAIGGLRAKPEKLGWGQSARNPVNKEIKDNFVNKTVKNKQYFY